MKHIKLFFLIFLFLFTEVHSGVFNQSNNLACMCDKSNTLIFFDCKNKVNSFLLEFDKENQVIKNSHDERFYNIFKILDDQIIAKHINDDFTSTLNIKNSSESLSEPIMLNYEIFYPAYKKTWSYSMLCMSGQSVK